MTMAESIPAQPREPGEGMRELVVYGPKGALERLLQDNGVAPDQIVSVASEGDEGADWFRHRVIYRVATRN
jgi:hypothetical protein